MPSIVGNRYELHDLVAQGGYGMVFRATDTRERKPVAVKMLSGGTNQDPHVVERLVREQQALRALSGTHAVGAIDLCRAQTGALCLVMEWLDGVDMEQYLATLEQQGTRMQADELLRILRPVLDTLEKAHELGIVHRDIKPANIFLLSERRGVRLLDFGLSRLKSSSTLTAVGIVMGSPSYMAPEAWKGNSRAIGRQADLYSIAVIVFRALTGRVPFETDTLVEKMHLVTSGERPSLRARRPDLPLMLDVWAEHALAIDPKRRFQHASHLMAALEAALAGLPLPTHTLARSSKLSSIPAPTTTEAERESAVSVALSRAASLLKRLANSFSRVPGQAPQRQAGGQPNPPLRPELPKPPALPRAHSSGRVPPLIPAPAPLPEATFDNKTMELGDDDLLEWLRDDDMHEEVLSAGSMDMAPTLIDVQLGAALSPQVAKPDSNLEANRAEPIEPKRVTESPRVRTRRVAAKQTTSRKAAKTTKKLATKQQSKRAAAGVASKKSKKPKKQSKRAAKAPTKRTNAAKSTQVKKASQKNTKAANRRERAAKKVVSKRRVRRKEQER